MKIVVITGSTRGLGFGLAHEFLKRGAAVVVSGRSPASVASAVGELSARHPAERVLGRACDVTMFEQVQALWEAAIARFGRVDLWINNAGIAHTDVPFWQHPPDVYRDVVNTNLVGTLYGCRVALQGMAAQGGGFIYNMEGAGSGGQIHAGQSIYATTKAAVHYLTRALLVEAKDLPVKIGSLRPGMVVTGMLTAQYEGRPAEWERARRIFNILADRVETVAPFLAEKMLNNDRNGASLAWTSPPKMLFRFVIAPFRKRDLFTPTADGGGR